MEAMVRQAELEASQTVDKRQLEADEINGKLDSMHLVIKEVCSLPIYAINNVDSTRWPLFV